MILLKIFSRPFKWISSPSSIHIILRFVLFLVSLDVLCHTVLDLTFSVANVAIYANMSSSLEILSFPSLYSVGEACLCGPCLNS